MALPLAEPNVKVRNMPGPTRPSPRSPRSSTLNLCTSVFSQAVVKVYRVKWRVPLLVPRCRVRSHLPVKRRNDCILRSRPGSESRASPWYQAGSGQRRLACQLICASDCTEKRGRRASALPNSLWSGQEEVLCRVQLCPDLARDPV